MFGFGKASFNPGRFDAAWDRYVRAIAAGHSAFARYLAPGSPAADIDAAQAAIKLTFPADLRHLLTRHAGSIDGYQVLPGWELFSPARIADEWKIWKELRRDEFVPDNIRCAPEGPIRGDEWWRLGWIPFCGDGGGNHLCLDMEPAPGGQAGQVISMWHDDPARVLIAGSLTEFIEIIARDAEAGLLAWDEKWGGVAAADGEDPET
jgi:cell wall assembly regulator SMI1